MPPSGTSGSGEGTLVGRGHGVHSQGQLLKEGKPVGYRDPDHKEFG